MFFKKKAHGLFAMVGRRRDLEGLLKAFCGVKYVQFVVSIVGPFRAHSFPTTDRIVVAQTVKLYYG